MTRLEFRAFILPFPQRNVKKECDICKQSFGIALREHVCKRCYRSVCDNCSPYKVRSYRADLQHRLHRMCKTCHTQSQILQRYIDNNKVSWSEDSDICRMWLKQLGYQNRGSTRISSRRTLNNQQVYQVSIRQLWASLNFSFREFVGIAIDKSKKSLKQIQEEIEDCVSEVLTTMVNHRMEPQHAVYIAMFFLVHSSPNNAILFTKSLIQILSCQQPSIQNILYYLQRLQCSQIECYKLQSYLQSNLEQITQTVTINYFTAEISIQILSTLISKKYYEQLEKGIAYVINLRKDFITKNSNKPQSIKIDILKNTEGLGVNFRKAMKEIDEGSISGAFIGKKSQLGSFSDASSILHDKRIEDILKENEELKIKNRNQQQQIQRLKSENNQLIEKQRLLKNQTQSKDAWTKIRKKSIAMEKIAQQQNFFSKRASRFFPSYTDQSDYEKVDEEGSDYRQSIEFGIMKKRDSLEDELNISAWEIDEEIPSNSEEELEKSVKSSGRGYKFSNSSVRMRVMQVFEEDDLDEEQIDRIVEFNIVMQELRKTHKKLKHVIPAYSYEKNKGRIKYINKKKMVKRKRYESPSKPHKDCRMSTYSQKVIKLQNTRESNEIRTSVRNPAYEQIIYQKNEENNKLRKQIEMHQYNNTMLQKQMADLEAQINRLKNQNRRKNSQVHESESANEDRRVEQLQKQVERMKELNKQLLIKMKQLSNMLMDKQEQQVGYSDKSFEELEGMYKKQTSSQDQQCTIF